MNNTNQKTSKKPFQAAKKTSTVRQYHNTPFGDYIKILDRIDKGKRYSDEYGSIMLISILEELGEMARAYLAEHGRKRTNLAAQSDESFEAELGDLLVTIFRLARIKNINLHERIMYTLKKIELRKTQPKKAK